jgi:transposase
MSTKGMKNKEIAAAINIGESTVRRIKRLWYTTGYVVAQPATNGRPPALTSLDLEASTGCAIGFGTPRLILSSISKL